jgi:hypothetical protein
VIYCAQPLRWERYSPECVERLSGNSEWAPFRGLTSPHNGPKWHDFRRFALPGNAQSEPSRYFPDSLWKVNSRKSAHSIVLRTPPQNRKARSLAHPHSIPDPYMLWCWIDIPDRECSTAAVALDRTTHGSCVALHSPVSGVAIPGPCPYPRRRAFPCWVSSARSDRESCLR